MTKSAKTFRTPVSSVVLAGIETVSIISPAAKRIVAGILLLGSVLAWHETATAGEIPSRFNVRAQTACETEMLGEMDAHEVFSGRAYNVMTQVARRYRREIPHVYLVPGSWNMAYIAGSTAVDGRGKILIGQQAIERFDTIALEGFLGHEMAHLVGDNASDGCNDYVLRNPQMEANADALAARMLGRRPVKAFLERTLTLTEGQNWDAKRRLELLQLSKVSNSIDQTHVR
jgi:hypothetical protein